MEGLVIFMLSNFRNSGTLTVAMMHFQIASSKRRYPAMVGLLEV